MTAGNWRSVLGDVLDAVPRDEDRFVLEFLTQRDADGNRFKDLLPADALHQMNNEYHSYWWVNSGAPQSEAWIGRRWRVLRADADALTITFARIL